MENINPTRFPKTYEESRRRFRNYLSTIRETWPNAQLITHPVLVEEDLTQDWIVADATVSKDKAIIFTTGEHGIEGYVGSAAMDLFINEFLPRLDPRTTGISLVHAINPWGMSHFRRTNKGNVDVNRNFVMDPSHLDSSTNPDYAKLNNFLNPSSPPESILATLAHFITGLVEGIRAIGVNKLQRAVLLGQYAYPQGIYYGGAAIQPEAALIMALFEQVIGQYGQSCLLDMHTGYGPRYLMSIVNSSLEKRDSAELIRIFQYPNVVKTNPDEFYAIQGDMIDYFYRLAKGKAPDKPIYGTTFEFGTLGDSFTAVLRSLATMIDENRVHQFGSADIALTPRIHSRFMELYYPQEAHWREKAIENARQAMTGILSAEGFISS